MIDTTETAFDPAELVVDGVLRRARELVRRGWCQGALARRAGGGWTPIQDPQATQFCLIGALSVVGAEVAVRHTRSAAVARLQKAAGHRALALVNDAPGQSQEGILRLFDRALGGK